MLYLIYTKELCAESEEILRFLTEEKNLTVCSHSENCSILQSDSRMAQDAAIILVSDTAVKDKEWRTLVDELTHEVRLIPVTSTKNADYTNPELIPSRIKEINYIRIGEKHLKNIWNSLITEKEFFYMKNMVLLNLNAWAFSNRLNDFLMTDRKIIKQCLSLFQKKLHMEDDPYFREELSQIIYYLKTSMRHANMLLVKKIIDCAYVGSIAILAVILVVYVYQQKNLSKRAACTSMVVGAKADGIDPVTAIKLVDGIMNPRINDIARIEFYNRLSECLNVNWSNTKVGSFYKYNLNDAQFALDERYIWTANGNGNVAKWDTYTGKIVEQTKVSTRPLMKIVVSERENLFAVLDSDGYIFKKHPYGVWKRSPDRYDIPNSAETDFVCNEEKNWVAVADVTGKLLWLDIQSGFYPIWEGQIGEVFCMELTNKGLEAVVSKNDFLYDIYIYADGTVEETRIPISIDHSCSMDILNGVIVMSDLNFQIVTWNREDPDNIHSTGMVLSRPLCLCFLNNQMLIYQDRNTGTHLYDLKRRLDLGSILKDSADASQLMAFHNTVMARIPIPNGYLYGTENIEFLLPAEKPDDSDIFAVYKEKTMSSDGRIQQISIDNEYMIRVILHLAEGDRTILIDGANRYFIGKAQQDSSLVQNENDGTEAFYFVDKPVNFVGMPTVVGIAHDEETVLICSSDGSFFEVKFTEEGSFILGAQRQIPSHAAITTIYQTSDFYYLEDITGTFWRVRIGCSAMSPAGAIVEVKERLHYAVTEEICECVSEETLKILNVTIMQGGGAREWE